MNISKLIFLIFSLLHCSLVNAISSHDVFETTFSILSYAKWEPQTPTPLLCVLESNQMSKEFKISAKRSNNTYRVEGVNRNELNNTRCNVILFSTLTPQQESNIIQSLGYSTVLTISLNNELCEIGSSICLYTRDQRTAFKVNMNSLHKSKVRIDPRVLLLTKKVEP